MANFITDNLNQHVLIDINYLDVLGEDSFEFYLYKLLTEVVDLSEFEAKYKNKRVGRKAYPPALLLRVIFYAYYRGITSSRTMASLCTTDFTFMALAGGLRPHFTTIADFVSSNSEAMKPLFHKVLLICCDSGLVGGEHFAIDGCKLPCDASKSWSGTHKNLKKKSDKLKARAEKIIEKHKANDCKAATEDQEREKVTVETLLKQAKKIDSFLAENDKRMGVGRRPQEVQSNITDNESTKMKTSKGTIQGFNCQAASDELYQIVVQAEAFGVGQDQSLLKPMVEGIRNNLPGDPLGSGTLLTADTGYSSEANMQYVYEEELNAVIPDTNFRQRDPAYTDSESVQQHKQHKQHRQKTRKDKPKRGAVIPASEFAVNLAARTCICPGGNDMLCEGQAIKRERGHYIRFRGKLNDCRHCALQSKCMKNPIKKQGRQVTFLLEGESDPSFLDLMKHRIDSESGRRDYARRMWTIEPVFGNITSNKRLHRMSLRGKTKVTGQWLMYCMIHNIEKLWRYA